jgi:serine/threonine-protein kinase
VTDTSASRAQQHARIKRLYMEVVDLPDRAAQLAALAGSGVSPDDQVAVLRLLGHTGETTHFAAPVARASAMWLGQELPMGTQLGAWRLLKPLGEGGMGRVYLAERADGAYEQQAAVKLVRLASSPHAAERFTRERQILAGLDHPHIARLLDGGQTSEGWPFLVMEFVDGERIDTWCQQRQLDLTQRLALMQSLCEALTYAHRSLVIHCDLKPANVLVDRSGRLRLLDFGIAHLEGDEAGPAGLTPGYASPEQLAGRAPTTASDVYSLGRLLTELCMPVAGRRRTELQAIVSKATALLPEQRYADAAALAADLRRLLSHRPLEALGRAPLYSARKLLRRRWPWALAGCLALVGTSAFTWRLAAERDRALAAEQRAHAEAQAAQAVSDFLTDLFNKADSWNNKRASEVRAVELIERGEVRALGELKDQPALRAPLLDTLGHVRENLGHTENAARLYAEAIATNLSLGRQVRLPALYNALTFTQNRLGRYRAALRTVEAWQRLGTIEGSDDVSNLDNARGTVLTNLGRIDEARRYLEHSLAVRDESPDTLGGPPRTVRGYHLTANLALTELAAGNGPRAELLMRRALLPEDASAFRRHSVLAMSLMLQGRHADALAEFERADRAAVRDFGEVNGNRHRVLRDYGWALLQLGRAPDAVRVLRLALQCAEEGEAHGPLAAMTRSRMAEALAATGALTEAASQHEAALQLAASQEADGDPLGLTEIRQRHQAFMAQHGTRPKR